MLLNYGAMLDSGSMACSLSSCMLALLEQANVVSSASVSPTSVVLIGCGGLKTNPMRVCEQINVLDCHISVHTLIVERQSDNLILGSIVIKHLIRALKHSDGFSEKVSLSGQTSEEENLLLMLALVEKWRGDEFTDKVGTVKLKHAVILLDHGPHLWLL